MWLWSLVAAGVAQASPPESQLVWTLSVKGAVVGSRQLTVRYLEADGGTSRALESYTDIDGTVGPLKVHWRQRLSAHIDAREPASFTSVVDQNGAVVEVQGRWTPSKWAITSTANGRSRASDLPLNRVDLSTADLMDPYTLQPLSRFTGSGAGAKILSAETGDVLEGPVENLGVSEIKVKGVAIQVNGYSWTSSQGRSEFYYSADGYLVKYKTQLLGVDLEAVLAEAPPGGVDDFPVATARPKVEVVDL